MKNLTIDRTLHDGTLKETIIVGHITYALHTIKDEVIITDVEDFTKIYAICSMEFYAQLMVLKLMGKL